MVNGAAVPRDRGFALVEALASLVIVAMVSLMLIEGIGTGRRVWERFDKSAGAADRLIGAQSLLRDRVGQLFPATAYDQTPPYVDFDGTQNALAFLAAPAMAERPAPLRRYRLFLAPSGDLVLTSVSDAAAAPDRRPVAEVLLTGVGSMDIAYFGGDAADPAPSWRESWRREPKPPQAVRIRLAFPPGDRRWWPDLIVRPMPTVGSDCSYNPAAGGRCANGA